MAIDARALARAIKQTESGGNYSAKGGSGEYGAYQFMPQTYKQWAGEHLGNPNAPMTPANQDTVAERQISKWVAQGYNLKQIASLWNAGKPDAYIGNVGTNRFGVRYNTPLYAQKVEANYSGKPLVAGYSEQIKEMPTYPTNNIRNIGLSSGDPGAYQDLNQDQSQLFGLALMDLLKSYQKMGTRPFAEQELNAKESQARRVAYSDPSLRGASPALQAQARSASAAALQPTITSAQESQQTFGEQLKSFGSNMDRAFTILQQEEERQDRERKGARDDIYKAFETFGSKAKDLLDPKILKRAGYSDDAFSKMTDTLKEQELQAKLEKDQQNKLDTSVVEVGNRKLLINNQTGETIKDLGSATGVTLPPGSTPGINPATGQKYKFDTPQDIANLPVQELTKSIIAGYGTTKELSPSDKATVKTELYQVGFNPYDYINKKLDALVLQWGKVPDSYKGLFQGRLQPFAASRDPEVANFESQKQVLTREVARLFDVGVLSDQDVLAYKKAMPERGDSNLKVVQQKVEGLKTNLGGSLIGDGSVNQTGTTVMKGPDGSQWNVPNDKIELFKQNGYKL